MHQQEVFFKPVFEKNGSVTKTADELDVVSLIGNFLGFISRFKRILLSFAITGLLLGIYFYLSSPKQSSSKMILHSAVLTNQEEIEIIDDWNQLLSKHQLNVLAGVLNCREGVLKKLTSISAEEVQKVYSQNNPNGFIVNVKVKDTSILDELQKGIVYGLDNSPYVSEKLAAKRIKYNELIESVNQEIQKLNSTKQTVDDIISSKNPGSTPLLIDISRLNAEWIDLNEKLLNYQEELKFMRGVYVLENFNKGKLSRSLLKPLFFGLAAGCFLGYLLSLVLSVREKIKTFKKRVAAHYPE